jgi:hypothetical protein
MTYAGGPFKFVPQVKTGEHEVEFVSFLMFKITLNLLHTSIKNLFSKLPSKSNVYSLNQFQVLKLDSEL